MKKPKRPAAKAARTATPVRKPMKSSFELAMERLRANDGESGTQATPLTAAQKREVAEARRVASSRLAEREILFADSIRKTQDPAEREKAESEYQIDRQRINDDCERAIEAIRRKRG
ncbi:MAG: hypothetical protein M3167_03625 [Acidobacteriota bacterium]|nr:hypothetical protein [Acidobacteriota bacterium]